MDNGSGDNYLSLERRGFVLVGLIFFGFPLIRRGNLHRKVNYPLVNICILTSSRSLRAKSLKLLFEHKSINLCVIHSLLSI